MRRRELLIAVVLLVALTAGNAWAQAERIGLVKTATGETVVIRDDERMAIAPGAAVYLGDVLETGDPGSLGVTLKDSTRVSLGPNARLELSEFVFVPVDEKFSFVSRLARGTLFYVSGLIAKLAPETVAIETPTATIGVRGTRFLVRVDD